MNKYVIHSFNRGFPIVVEGEHKAIDRVLIKSDTYDGVTVQKLCNGKDDYLKLLNGSKMAMSIKEDSKYGYEHNVARKLGNIAGERFLRNPSKKITVIKTKVNLLNNHHATVKSIIANIKGGLYEKLRNDNIMIYNVGVSYLFINLNKNENLTVRDLKQTIQAIVDTYQPELRIIC